MNLREYIGRTVLLNLTETYSHDNQPMLGCPAKARLFYAQLKDVDEHGLWVENPVWSTRNARSGEGSTHKILFLIPWFALVSIAIFPDRVFPQDQAVPDENIRTIGFAP